jgi:hypothetical protein
MNTDGVDGTKVRKLFGKYCPLCGCVTYWARYEDGTEECISIYHPTDTKEKAGGK